MMEMYVAPTVFIVYFLTDIDYRMLYSKLHHNLFLLLFSHVCTLVIIFSLWGLECVRHCFFYERKKKKQIYGYTYVLKAHIISHALSVG